jgi:hypothetical protein
MSRFGSRKFLLAVGFVLACIGLLCFGKLDQAAFVTLSQWALSGYLGANVLHRLVEKGVSLPAGGKEVA